MSGDCGHGWGYHSKGASGPCDLCTKHSLPIVEKVKEVYSFTDPNAFDHVGHFAIVAPDPRAGKKNRYSVICIDYQSGCATVTGRELPLAIARKIAKKERIF